LGNEHDGISGELASACTRHVRVPMRGFVESLNVSVSAAILLASATAGRAGDLPEADQRRLYARGLYLSVGRADDVLAAEDEQ
jgi:tRNA (guanosine-2'-O-)-methyltransferase